MTYLSLAELEAGLDAIRQSPKDCGVLKRIVRRPAIDERESLEFAELDPIQGLLGDNWLARGNPYSPNGSADPDAQITIMNARVAALVAQDESRWQMAGDQLYLDMDLCDENLPPGARLSLGSTIIEVTAIPHTGCKKFAQRFGPDATKFVNSPEGRRLHLRGLNAKVIQGGAIRVGDVARKL